jgi:hypothetical protein
MVGSLCHSAVPLERALLSSPAGQCAELVSRVNRKNLAREFDSVKVRFPGTGIFPMFFGSLAGVYQDHK